jgi:hypothetical protein
MDVAGLLVELYGRIPPLARGAVDALDAAALTWSPAPGTNHIGWLVWHLTRVQDVHIAELLVAEQIWPASDFPRRCGLEPDPANTGYGHTAADVARVQPDGASVLVEYLDAVHGRTCSMLDGLTPADLDRIVDRHWDPPVTLGVRLVSVADDCLQHVGQAAYVRGLLRR